MRSNNFFVNLSVAAIFSVIFSVQIASATFIDLTRRDGFEVGNPDGKGKRGQHDEAKFNTLFPKNGTGGVFGAFTDGNIYSVDSFTAPTGSTVSITNLAEIASFDGDHISGIANNFGISDQNGNFVSMFNSNNKGVGGTGKATLTGGKTYDFTLQSGFFNAASNPNNFGDYLFSSNDSKNNDKLAHMIALNVTKAGTVTIPFPQLPGGKQTGAFSFNLLPGDIIIGVEDLLNINTFTLGGRLPGRADFDYQDMLFVVRAQAVPEPTTLALLGAGLIAGAGAKRRRARMKS